MFLHYEDLRVMSVECLLLNILTLVALWSNSLMNMSPVLSVTRAPPAFFHYFSMKGCAVHSIKCKESDIEQL